MNTLCALWERVAVNFTPTDIAKEDRLPILSQDQFVILDDLVEKRLNGIPLAHLTERQFFLGMEFAIKKGLYIPRKETELLAQTAISCITSSFQKKQLVNVIDVCTGIGTVALAIANYCNNTIVYGSDIFEPAIDMAIINSNHFNLEERSTFL